MEIVNKGESVLLIEEIEGFVDEIVSGIENMVDEELRIQIQRIENRLTLTSFHSLSLASTERFPAKLKTKGKGGCYFCQSTSKFK